MKIGTLNLRKIRLLSSLTMVFLCSAFASQTYGAVVINEIYPSGGNGSGANAATYNQDFVELYNNGATSVDISGFSLQYNTAAGTGTYTVCNITATDTVIEPGTYFLIATGPVDATVGTPLPTANATCTINLAVAGGKIALVSSTAQLTGPACPPTGATIVDFVGYGTANCSETAPEPAPPNNQTSLQRTPTGTDSGNNAADFQALTATPQASGVTAADGIISGRITTNRGRGIPYATLILSGGDLEEPIYATTSTFGYYQFPEVATGATYILQVFSRRFTFEPSSRVVNLNDNFTGADFIGTETWSNSRIR